MEQTARLFTETAMRLGGPVFDYSEESVAQLDDWADQLWDPAGPRPGEAELDSYSKLMGAYLGEVIVRHIGGRWIWAKDPKQPAVELEAGKNALVLNKAYKRQLNGRSDSFADFYAAARQLSREGLPPTVRWTHPALWEMDVPPSWAQDDTSRGVAFVPPSGLGRLSVFTVRAKEPVEIDEDFVRAQAQSFAEALGLAGPDASAPVVRRGNDHYAMELEGEGRGRATFAVVHVMGPALIACAAWHTQDRRDPDWDQGVAAARGLRPEAVSTDGARDIREH